MKKYIYFIYGLMPWLMPKIYGIKKTQFLSERKDSSPRLQTWQGCRVPI